MVLTLARAMELLFFAIIHKVSPRKSITEKKYHREKVSPRKIITEKKYHQAST
jgi:hypothetical protein